MTTLAERWQEFWTISNMLVWLGCSLFIWLSIGLRYQIVKMQRKARKGKSDMNLFRKGLIEKREK